MVVVVLMYSRSMGSSIISMDLLFQKLMPMLFKLNSIFIILKWLWINVSLTILIQMEQCCWTATCWELYRTAYIETILMLRFIELLVRG